MTTIRPRFTTRVEHLQRISEEKDSIQVRPACITTGQAALAALEGIAITVSGQARIILPVPEAWKLSDDLVDVLEALRDDDTPITRFDGQLDADGELSESLPDLTPEE